MSELNRLLQKYGVEAPKETQLEQEYEKYPLNEYSYATPDDYDSYNAYGVDYDPTNIRLSEDERASNQSWYEKAAKGVGNLANSTLFGVASIAGYGYGLATAVGAGSNRMWEGDFSSAQQQLFNNNLIQAIESAKQSVSEDFLKIYVPHDVEEGGVLKKLSSLSWLGSTGADMAGFIASMFAPGAVLKGLGVGGRIVKAANAYEDVVKAMQAADGVTDVAQGVRRIGELEKLAQKVRVGALNLSSLTFGEKAALSQLDNIKFYGANAINSMDSAMSVGANTLVESMAEASQSYADIYTSAKAKGLSEEEARKVAGTSSSAVFAINIATLALSNTLFEKMILNGFTKKAASTRNTMFAKGLSDDILGGTTRTAEEILENSWWKANKITNAIGTIGKPVAWATDVFVPAMLKEGVYEEGLQTTASQIAKQDALGEHAPSNFLQESLRIVAGVPENYMKMFGRDGNKELKESILLGGLFGGFMEGGAGLYTKYKKGSEKDRQMANFNAMGRNFIGMFTPTTDMFKRHEATDESGKPNPLAGQLVLDKDNKPIIDPVKAKLYTESMLTAMQDANELDTLRAADPNSTATLDAEHSFETAQIAKTLMMEGGYEVFQELVSSGALKELFQKRYTANTNQKLSEEAANSMVAEWAATAKRVKEEIDFVNDTHILGTYITPTKEQKAKFAEFSERYRLTRLSNYSKYRFLNKMLATEDGRKKELDDEEAALKAQLDAYNFNADPSTADPKKIAEHAQNKQEYADAEKLFEDYNKAASKYGEGANYKDAAGAKEALEKIEKAYGEADIELTDEMKRAKADSAANPDEFNAHLKNLAELKSKTDAITKDEKHAYNKYKNARKNVQVKLENLEVAKEKLRDDLDTWNKMQLLVADKFNISGEIYKKEWKKFLEASKTAEEEAAKNKEIGDKVHTTTDNSLKLSSFTDEERALIIDTLINNSAYADGNPKANDAIAAFENLEFTIDAEGINGLLSDRYSGLDDNTKKELKRLQKIGGTWKVIGVPMKVDGEPKVVFQIVSNTQVNMPITKSDLKATIEKYPTLFTKNANTGDFETKQKQVEKRIAELEKTGRATDAAKLRGEYELYKKEGWVTSKTTTKRRVMLTLNSKEPMHIIKFTDHVSKFAPSTAANSSYRNIALRREFEPATVGYDHYVQGQGEDEAKPTLFVGQIPAVVLMSVMRPVNKNTVKANKQLKEALEAKVKLISKFQELKNRSEKTIRSIIREFNAIQKTQQDLEKINTELQKIHTAAITNPSAPTEDALNAQKAVLEATLKANISSYNSIDEALNKLREKLEAATNLYNAANQYYNALKALDNNAALNLKTGDLNSILTEEGKTTLETYLQEQKDAINERVKNVVRNKGTIGNAIVNADWEIKTAEKIISTITKAIAEDASRISAGTSPTVDFSAWEQATKNDFIAIQSLLNSIRIRIVDTRLASLLDDTQKQKLSGELAKLNGNAKPAIKLQAMQTILANIADSQAKTELANDVKEYAEIVEILEINETFKATASATDIKTAIQDAYDKRAAALKAVIAKYQTRKTKAEKAKVALEKLQAESNPNYAELQVDEFGEVIIKTFKDLIAAEQVAYQSEKLEDIAEYANETGNIVNEVLNVVKAQRNSLQQTATKLLFESVKKEEVENQVVALLESIPQIKEIFTVDGKLQKERMLAAMITVFNIKDTDAVYKSLLQALIDPITVAIRLKTYIETYNNRHGTSISTSFKGEDGSNFNLAETIETFTQTVGSDEFKTKFAKLKELNKTVEALRDTTALSALKLINSIEGFEDALYEIADQKLSGKETDSIINEDANALNPDIKYGQRASGGDRTTGGAENPNDLMIKLDEDSDVKMPFINGEHYAHTEQLNNNTPAVYKRIELPKNTDNPELHKKILDLFISDNFVSLDADTVTEDLKTYYGEGEVAAQKRAITAYRRYANNNRFFYWTDTNPTLQAHINNGEVYLQAMTYGELQNSKDPDIQAIAKTIDMQTELEAAPGSKTTLEGFKNNNNVLFIPHIFKQDKLVPVKGLTQIEEEYNATQKIEGNKIPAKVLFTSRPLASSLYPVFPEKDRTEYQQKIEKELGFELANPNKTKLGTPGIDKLLESTAVKIADKPGTGIEITYVDAEAKTVKKTITLSAEEVAKLGTKRVDTDAIDFRGVKKTPREMLLMSIALSVASQKHEAETQKLIASAGSFVQVEQRNQGYPNFAVIEDKDGNVAPAQMKLATAFPGKELGLTVVTKGNTADYPGTILGEVVVKVDDTFVPVVNTTFKEVNPEIKNNMLDILSLTLMKIQNTPKEEGLKSLRGEVVPFGGSKKIAVRKGNTKDKVEISGYTYYPDFDNNATTISAIGFYMNFGVKPGKDGVRNAIYIEGGNLVFTQRSAGNTFETTRIPLQELENEAGVINLKAKFSDNNKLGNAKNESIAKLQIYLESKRVNVNKKLTLATNKVTMIPKVDGTLSRDSKIAYKEVGASYQQWAINNIISTNYAKGSKRRHLQRNLKHTSHIQSDAAVIAAATAKQKEREAKLKAEQEKAKENAKEKEKPTAPVAPSTEPTGGVDLTALSNIILAVQKEQEKYPEATDILFADVVIEGIKMNVRSILSGIIRTKGKNITKDEIDVVNAFFDAYNTDLGVKKEEPPAPPTNITPPVQNTTPPAKNNPSKKPDKIVYAYFDKVNGMRPQTKKDETSLFQVEIDDSNPTIGVLKLVEGLDANTEADLVKFFGTFAEVWEYEKWPESGQSRIEVISPGEVYKDASGYWKINKDKKMKIKFVDPAASTAKATSSTSDMSQDYFDTTIEKFANSEVDDIKTSITGVIRFNNVNVKSNTDLKFAIEGLEYSDYVKLNAADKAIVNTEFRRPEFIPFSKFNTSDKDRIIFAEAKANVAAMFGQKFADSEVDLVVGLIQEEGYGAFTQDGKILLSNQAEAGTEYHEAFHRVWRRFTSPFERNQLIAEFEQRADKEQRIQEIRDAGYTGSRNYLIEEILAEEFKLYSNKYKLKNGKLVPKSFLERLFDRLVRFLSAIVGRPLQQQLYDNILNGKYAGRTESRPYENHAPILSRTIKFASNDATNNTYKVSSDIAIAVNEAITVGMFSEELQKGKLYDVLNNIETDLTASFKTSLQTQLVNTIRANKNKKGGYKYNAAILNQYLPEVEEILNGPYDAYFKMFVLNSSSLVRILHNSKMLGNLLTDLDNIDTLLENEQEILNEVMDWYNEDTPAPLTTSTAETARLALSMYFQLKYAKDPAARKFAMNMGRNAKYPKDYFAYLYGTKVQKPNDTEPVNANTLKVDLNNGLFTDPLILNKVLANALNESLHIDVLAAIGNRNDNVNNAEYKELAETTFKNVYRSDDPATFYNQWKRSISNVGGKISATRLEVDQLQDEENDQTEQLEEAQDTRNASFDKITFETDPRTSASTAFKLLIGASQAVDREGKPILNVYGLPKAVDYNSTINKLINVLGNVPQFALWDEFVSFIEADNTLISMAKAIDAMPEGTTEDKRKKESIKVKIIKTFNNHIYDFSVNIIERNNVFSMSANSNSTARSLRESWKGVLASEYAEEQRTTLGLILYNILNKEKPLDVWAAGQYNDINSFSYYLNLLGIQIAPETLKAMTANEGTRKYWGTVINDLYSNIFPSNMDKLAFLRVTGNPSEFANAVFGYGTEGSKVGSKIDAIALFDAEHLKDKSQALMSNGKMYFAANLNNHMTHTIDTLNYIATAPLDVLNKYIEEQLENPYQAYYNNKELLKAHAEAWLVDANHSGSSNPEPEVLARIKLLMLTTPHLFSAYNRHSYYIERAIFTGQKMQIQVFESVKNTINNDSKNLSKMSNIELLTHFANNVLSGISRVMQHADRGTTYGLNMSLSSSEADLRIIERLNVTNDSVVLFMDELDNNTNTGYFEYNAASNKKYNPTTKGLHPEAYGVLSEYMQTAFEKNSNTIMPQVPGDLSHKYFKDFAVFAREFNIEEHEASIKEYIKQEKIKFIKIYEDAGLLAVQENWVDGKVNGVRPRYIVAGNVESTEQNGVTAELKLNLATVWSRSILTHLEETILFTGNANKYKSPEDMFKRLNVQSSSGVLANSSESFLDSVHQANIDAQTGLSDLGADAYTSQDSTKDLSLITEVVTTEQSFTSEDAAAQVENSVYRTMYKLSRLRGLSHPKADKAAREFAKESASGYLDGVNENDGQSWLNIFAYRQYLKSVDSWSEAQEKSFKYEMYVLADMVRVKNNIERLESEGKTPTEVDYAYTPEELLLARLITGNNNLSKAEYKRNEKEYSEKINAWLSDRGGLAVLKPQYTGPVWMSEQHRLADPLKRDTNAAVRKTSYDMLLPSMVRGESYDKRAKFADLMFSMHEIGLDVVHMKSAAKAGTKKPVDLFKATGNNIGEINPALFNNANHTYLEWKYMKDQQAISTEQYKEITDSVQARRNILGNQTHLGVPIDFAMQDEFDNWYTEEEWVSNWEKLNEDEKLEASRMYRNEQEILDIQHEILIKSVNKLARELDYDLRKETYTTKQNEAIAGITNIVRILQKESERRDMPDNVISAIQSLIDNKYVDILPNAARIEPILMSIVSNNLLRLKRPGNMVPQIAITGMDKVGTVRQKLGATRELNTYNIDQYEAKDTEPAEIITSLPDTYKKAVLNRYAAQTKNPNITLFEAVRLLNEDIANKKVIIEVFALRIPNQQMSSNDVFKVKQFYIGTKENFVYVPSETVVKAGSDFDIDKMNMYWSTMDENLEPVAYVQGSKTVRDLNNPNNRGGNRKTFAQEVETLDAIDYKIQALEEAIGQGIDVDKNLKELLRLLEEKGEVTRENCNDAPTAEQGMLINEITPGGKWEVIKEFKGKSHKEGGIDITVGNGQISMVNNNTKQPFKAAKGLVIAASGLVVGGGNDLYNPVITDPTNSSLNPDRWKYNKTKDEYIAPQLNEVTITAPKQVNHSSKTPNTTVASTEPKPERSSWEIDRDTKPADKIHFWETLNYKKWGLNDYSDYSSFNSAFRNAREKNEQEFVYKDKRYNTKLIDKEQSDLYWESKKFLTDYYKQGNFKPTTEEDETTNWNAYTKAKYGTTLLESLATTKNSSLVDINKLDPNIDDVDGSVKYGVKYKSKEYQEYLKEQKSKKEIANLNTPSYFSITDSKPKDMKQVGHFIPSANKLFMGTKVVTGKFPSTYIHELSHKADIYDVEKRTPPIDRKILKEKSPIPDYEFNYLADPTEIEARKMSTLFYAYKNKADLTKMNDKELDDWYTANEADMPFDIKQLFAIYAGQRENLYKYLKNDFSYLDKNKNEKPTEGKEKQPTKKK